MYAPKPRPRTILTGDGELQEIDGDSPAMLGTQPSAIFCTNCGTANQAHSSFCRSCGQSLDEQMIDAANLEIHTSRQKRKRDGLLTENVSQTQSLAQVAGLLISDIVSMLFMGGLAIWTLTLGQGGITALIIIVWFLLEMSRHGWIKSNNVNSDGR